MYGGRRLNVWRVRPSVWRVRPSVWRMMTPRLGEAAPTGAQELLGDRAPGLLVGFASSKVADTTFAGSRGCGVCVNSSDELGIALTAHEFSVAQSGYFFPLLLDRGRNTAVSLGYLYFGFAVSGVFVGSWCNWSYR